MREFFYGAWDWILRAIAALGGMVAGALGGWDAALQVLVVMMAIDYATGLCVAAMGRSAKTQGGGLDSNVGLHGLLRKGLMLLVVLCGAMLDRVIGAGAICRDACCWFYIANEGLSILENTALAGVPYPEAVKHALEQTRDRGEEETGA